MIRVVKPDEPPSILKEKGRRATERLREAFDEGRLDDLRSERGFDRRLYGAKVVKEALIRAQHGKCAFCESRITHVSYGDVEHFRPKAAYHQREGEPLERPGYYWLAYEWTNLFFACQICNQRHKKNLFPLKSPKRRARSHHDGLDEEKPLLIDPGAEDPRAFIGFRAEMAYPLRDNARGRETIEALGLNREEMVESRRECLARIKVAIETIEVIERPGCPRDAALRRRAEELRAALRDLARDDAPYASMARSATRRVR